MKVISWDCIIFKMYGQVDRVSTLSSQKMIFALLWGCSRYLGNSMPYVSHLTTLPGLLLSGGLEPHLSLANIDWLNEQFVWLESQVCFMLTAIIRLLVLEKWSWALWALIKGFYLKVHFEDNKLDWIELNWVNWVNYLIWNIGLTILFWKPWLPFPIVKRVWKFVNSYLARCNHF